MDTPSRISTSTASFAVIMPPFALAMDTIVAAAGMVAAGSLLVGLVGFLAMAHASARWRELLDVIVGVVGAGVLRQQPGRGDSDGLAGA